MIGPKESWNDLKYLFSQSLRSLYFTTGQWKEYAALIALAYAVEFAYRGLRHFFGVWTLVGAAAVVWLVLGTAVSYWMHFGPKNYRGAIGCEQKRINEFSWGGFFVLIGFFPVIMTMWSFDKIKKKLGR